MDWLLILMLSAAAPTHEVAGDTVEQPRQAVLVDQQAQDEAVAAAMLEMRPRDATIWLDPGAKRGLVVARRAHRGKIKGSVVLLAQAEGGPDGFSHAAQIRRGLALHGWHTYFARVPQEGQRQRVQTLVSLVRERGAEGALVLISEGSATHWAAAAAAEIAVDGLVLVNVPESSVEFPTAALLADLAAPALLLQEHPYDWHQQDPLGADVELHRLPPGDARREDNWLIRKIRGWFKRRFEGANA